MSGKPTYDEALCFMADAMLYQRIDLTGPWQGWKLRGRVLVSPDGDRVPAERLRGMLFTESLKRPKRNKPGPVPKHELEQRPSASVVSLPIGEPVPLRKRFG